MLTVGRSCSIPVPIHSTVRMFQPIHGFCLVSGASCFALCYYTRVSAPWSVLYSLVAAYLPTYLDPDFRKGGRPWPALQRWSYWNKLVKGEPDGLFAMNNTLLHCKINITVWSNCSQNSMMEELQQKNLWTTQSHTYSAVFHTEHTALTMP